MRNPFKKQKPTRFYRYTKLNEFTLSALKENKIWLSSPEKLNDPFDCQLEIAPIRQHDRTLKVLNAALSTPVSRVHMVERDGEKTVQFIDGEARDYSPELATVLLDNAHEMFRLPFQMSGVHCVSELATSTLMWSHYAGQHSGICLELNLRVENLHNPAEGFDFLPVKYSRNYPRINSFEAFLDFDETFRKMVLTKAKEWEYEKELRLLHQHGNQLVNSPFTLSRVFFGILSTKDTKSQVLKALANRNDIEYFQAFRHPNAFFPIYFPFPDDTISLMGPNDLDCAIRKLHRSVL